MGEAKRKRRNVVRGQDDFDATVEDLMQAQAEWRAEAHVRAEMKRPDGMIEQTPENMKALNKIRVKKLAQSDIPPALNVFATMEAAWNDLVDRWFHEGMPDKLKQDGKFIFFHGVQAAANLMMYCEGQDMFGAAADQVQGDCIAYEKEAEAVLAERKADEWRTGEI